MRTPTSVAVVFIVLLMKKTWLGEMAWNGLFNNFIKSKTTHYLRNHYLRWRLDEINLLSKSRLNTKIFGHHNKWTEFPSQAVSCLSKLNKTTASGQRTRRRGVRPKSMTICMFIGWPNGRITEKYWAREQQYCTMYILMMIDGAILKSK